ncbi:MAG: ATP-binding protein [Plectolyngbya sp. WJT66-NPBG17]|jgi:hypothetical protein|nr:ATP-binding protein [Plectolyngbya sp. WJT66-NPBG17]
MSILDDIYNAFEPEPLPAGSPVYVDCKAVRGGSNIFVELGRTIQKSNKYTCQLYTGHRGGGKSTELLRLEQDLEQKGCVVVYFSAEDEDINTEDVEYTDLLLACTRHLLERVKQADAKPILSWLQDRAKAFDDVLNTQIFVDDPKLEIGIKEFAKITGTIRTQPTQRAKLREILTPYTENLVKALNYFIDDAYKKLPPGKNKIVLIADGLEKITLITKDGGRTNHDEIFIDRSTQLRGLNCHVIYTVPISLVLSSRASDLMEIYNCTPQVLPMVMVRTKDNQPYQAGIEAMKQIVRCRIKSIDKAKGMALVGEVFDTPETLEQFCLISGGHVRNLVLLMQTAIKYNEEERLPISGNALLQAIRQLRKTYRDTVNSNQWSLLATVHQTKTIPNDDAHRSLLFNRCLLEYLVEGETWQDVHPVLLEVSEFKTAFKAIAKIQT